jgi:hypothetical protein
MRKSSFLAFLVAATLGVSGLAIASGALAANGPGVGTGNAAEVTNTTAAVIGAIDPNGQDTTYAFQYGTTIQYSGQTAVHSVGPPITYKTVTAQLTGLRPGTTYHFRVIAANASGTMAGSDVTFKTGGLAPAFGVSPVAVTGAATAIGAHDAVLTGTLNPSGSNVRYYFQLGTRQPYEFQTISQTLPAGRPGSVQAPVSGLQSDQVFHYRLVAVSENGEVSAGSEQSFLTVPSGRLNPSALQVSVSPAFQRRLPDTVTVSGRLVPPRSLPRAVACQGFVDIAFRVRTIPIQLLRGGIHADCTFRLRLRFSVRRRLLGGHVNVHVLFPGNEVLHRLAAPTRRIQIG